MMYDYDFLNRISLWMICDQTKTNLWLNQNNTWDYFVTKRII